MTDFDIALATCRTLPEPDPDESPLREALTRAGLSVRTLAWDDPDAPFDRARRVVIRSTWNYVHHLDAFLAWVDRVGARLINPAPVVRWNVHKSYLHDLEREGVAVVPTELVRRDSGRALGDVLASRGWSRAVVKPAVSAASFETRVARAPSLDGELSAWFARVLEARDMLVQPYMSSVEDYGERALIWIDGEVTHAIRKSPRFAGHDECVSSDGVPVAEDERVFAEAAVRAAQRCMPHEAITYARVDLVRDEEGLRVMELELIEPSLFFTQGPRALERFGEVLGRSLTQYSSPDVRIHP